MNQQLVEIEEHPKVIIKLGDSSVLKQLIAKAVETNSTTHAKDSVVVSLIGKQKTYKSTHANLIFGTSFPKGMLGMEQTTKGILVESSVLRHNGSTINLQCLDYEGFGSTGRDLMSQEEKALDNKLMLLSYSISNVVVFSMHAADVSPFREFVQLMRMCVKGIRSDDQSKKPSLVIFVNVTLGDKCTIINNALNGGMGLSSDQIREGIHQFATRSLLAQKDFNDCKMYFSDVTVETMYPNNMGNQTEAFIIEQVKNSLISKCISSESQDTGMLYDQNRWLETISSINSNEQIEFASDVLGKISEGICSSKFELLKNQFEMEAGKQQNISDLNDLKSRMLMEYWKEAKGKFAAEFGTKLESSIQALHDKLSKRVLNNQIVGLVQDFEKEMSKFLQTDNFSFNKLHNFYTSCIENYEIYHSDNFASTEDFQRLVAKVETKYSEMMEDYSINKRKEAEEIIRQQLKNDIADYESLLDQLDIVKERLSQINISDKESVERWYQRLINTIGKRKAEQEHTKSKSNQLKNDMINLKVNFLDALSKMETIEEMDLLIKKSLILLDNHSADKDSVNNMEKFFRVSCDERLQHIIPSIISKVEVEFKNGLDASLSAESCKNLLQTYISKIPNANIQLYDQSKKKLQERFTDSTITKAINEYKANNIKSAKEWFELSINQGLNDSRPHFYLGEMFKNGSGVAVSLEKAFENYLKSAKMGNADSQFCVATMYLNGEGTKQSNNEAQAWYDKAAKQGHEEAVIQLQMVKDGKIKDGDKKVDSKEIANSKILEKSKLVNPSIEIKQLRDEFLNKFSNNYIPIVNLHDYVKSETLTEEKFLAILELWGDDGLRIIFYSAPSTYHNFMNNLKTLEKVSDLDISLPVDEHRRVQQVEPTLFNSLPEEKCIQIATKLKCIPSRFLNNSAVIKKIIKQGGFKLFHFFKDFSNNVKEDPEIIAILAKTYAEEFVSMMNTISHSTVFDCPDLYLKYLDVRNFRDCFSRANILKSDRNFILKMMNRFKEESLGKHFSLYQLSPNILDDEEIVRQAIALRGGNIIFASNRFQMKLDCIMLALDADYVLDLEPIIRKYFINSEKVLLKAAMNGLFIVENNSILMNMHTNAAVRQANIEKEFRVPFALLSDLEYLTLYTKANPNNQQLNEFPVSIRSNRDLMISVIQKRESRFGPITLGTSLTEDADFMEKCIDLNLDYAAQLAPNLKSNLSFATKLLHKHPEVLFCLDPLFHIEKTYLMNYLNATILSQKPALFSHLFKYNNLPFDKDYWDDLIDMIPAKDYIEKAPGHLRNNYKVKVKSTRVLVPFNEHLYNQEYKFVDVSVNDLVEAIIRIYKRTPKIQIYRQVFLSFQRYPYDLQNLLESRLLIK